MGEPDFPEFCPTHSQFHPAIPGRRGLPGHQQVLQGDLPKSHWEKVLDTGHPDSEALLATPTLPTTSPFAPVGSRNRDRAARRSPFRPAGNLS